MKSSARSASRLSKIPQFSTEFTHRKCIIRVREEKSRVVRFRDLRIHRICLLDPQRMADLVRRYSLGQPSPFPDKRVVRSTGGSFGLFCFNQNPLKNTTPHALS